MKLIAYELYDNANFSSYIKPASKSKKWMDDTGKFAYRCLPLTVANMYGWEILSPVEFEAVWDGGNSIDSVKVFPENPHVKSHFGYGILTFLFPVVFNTEPGWDLMVFGPMNEVKDAIVPLHGVVETDWLPFTFTMNWKFTRPSQRIKFEHKEAFCNIFPTKRGSLEAFQPQIKKISDDLELKDNFEKWVESRRDFISNLANGSSEDTWQKFYHKAVGPENKEYDVPNHKTKLSLKNFTWS
jgi:hypothetical protein